VENLKKKMIIAGLLVVCMLLFVPTVSATQINIENNTSPIKDTQSQIKHKLLRLSVIHIIKSRISRGEYFFDLSVENGPMFPYRVIHPLLYIKSHILFIRAEIWSIFWFNIADTFDWNW